MARVELKFLDFIKSSKYITAKSKTDFRNYYIEIDISNENIKEISRIQLDKSTAIKWAKTLRTEINKITEREVGNG